ncbi:hypothetical protein PMAYCL1PPCAC_28815, partial [Pristionchus mayeri]
LLERNRTAPWYRRQFTVGSPQSLRFHEVTIDVTLHCQKGFFGAACALHCVSDSRKNCDSQGQFSCQEGWTGPDCDRDASSPSSISSSSSPSVDSDQSYREYFTNDKLVFGLYLG